MSTSKKHARINRAGLSGATALAMAAYGVAVAAPAHAATATVNLCGAGQTGAQNADAFLTAVAAMADNDTLNLTVTTACTVDLAATTRGSSSIALVNLHVTINGPGQSLLTVKSGTRTAPMFNVAGGSLALSDIKLQGLPALLPYVAPNVGYALVSTNAPVTLNRVTMADNEAYTGGGGVYQYPGVSLTITDSVFDSLTASQVGAFGGAIYAEGNLTVSDSVFTDNAASAFGGAIAGFGSTTSISGSYFEGNTATSANGGAVRLQAGSVENSTFVGNSSPNGAAIFVGTTATVKSVTAWNNTPGAPGASVEGVGGGGLFASIVGGDDNTKNSVINMNDLGVNLVTATTWIPGAGTNTQVVTAAELNLLPAALNTASPANSGATKTIALGSTSVARDYYTPGVTPTAVLADPTYVPTVDQRGVTRPQGSAYDVGAYEGAAPAACVRTTLGSVLFTSFSSRLTISSRRALSRFGHSVVSHNCAAVYLDAHTSTVNGASKSTETVRTRIAKARNRSVAAYLRRYFADHGVVVIVHARTHNADHPVASNAGKRRYLNRRVVVGMGPGTAPV